MKNLTTFLLTAILLCGLQTAAHATPAPKLYTLKGDTQGSRIPSIDAKSTIPFNKRFNSLTIEQQNLVKAKFEELGANDSPPFPTRGLRAVYKTVIQANKNYGDNSPLKVTATVDKKGRVSEVVVHNNTNRELVSYIERNLQYAKFDAARCNGVACEMDFPIEISFN